MVSEKRYYASWTDSTPNSPNQITNTTGIIAAKKILNALHKQLAEEGYNEIYVDQVTEEIIAVTRHCPAHHKSYILMAHTAFWPPGEWAIATTSGPNIGFSDVPPLTIQGQIKVSGWSSYLFYIQLFCYPVIYLSIDLFIHSFVHPSILLIIHASIDITTVLFTGSVLRS